MLPSNLGVPISEPTLSTPIPLLPRVPSVAFPITGSTSGSVSSSVVASESPFPQKMPVDSNYPRIKDNSSIFPVQSISPMHTDPPNLLFLPPADRASPIVDRAFGFEAESETHRLQRCDYPRIKDTCTIEHHFDTNAAMEDAQGASSAAESKDATEIECALWNASINRCKDALPAFHSTDDDKDEIGSEDQVDACMSDDLSFGGLSSTRALQELDANPAKCFG